MKVCFVSNYINHHQIPLCRSLKERLEAEEPAGEFWFIQTQPMEAQRVEMGWDENNTPDFVVKYYEEGERAVELIRESDMVIFGGVDDESYIKERLEDGKPILRYCERMYKTGQWKAVSPRGLRQKYLDHTSRRKKPVYVLCAGGYVADDFRIVHAYRGKMYCFGYFPETRTYDVDKLLEEKGYPVDKENKIPYLLWAGRMIRWKHPELAIEAALHLKKKGMTFHLDLVGGGDLEPELRRRIEQEGLSDCVTLRGFRSPQEVRGFMEKADVFLFTSDRNEGWGAVANEAMNSGCTLVCDHMIGAAPYLIRPGENGCIYRSGDKGMFLGEVEKCVADPELRKKLGREAYHTISRTWNPDFAAGALLDLMKKLLRGSTECSSQEGVVAPCVPAPVVRERRMFDYMNRSRDRV